MKQVIDLPTHFENESICMKFISGKNYMLELWKGFAQDEEIKLAKNKALQILKNIKTSGYLSDLKSFKGASPESQKWVRDIWVPELYRVGIKKIALVVGEDVFAMFSVNAAISGDYAKKMDVQKFVSIQEAEKWLKEVI